MMDHFNRRDFLRGSSVAAAAASLAWPADVMAARTIPSSGEWDHGSVRHLLPTASHNRILIKASFRAPLPEAPTLRIGGNSVRGRMNDTRGEFWQFHVADLKPGRAYTLALSGSRGRALCEPWSLATFPGPDAQPQSFRVLFYTCAGGHEAFAFLPAAVRNRLLRRGLSFGPAALVAIGDQIYWDLLAPQNSRNMGASPLAEKLAGKFDRSALVLGSDNETVLKRAAGPQIVPVYGTDFRSIPVFFMQDDHDYFDNDEATDEIVTFPPPYFSLQLGRATQSLFYPEYLPDVARPLGLPWSSVGDRIGGV
jgi:TAT (twin-arginine translocation) pathway-exported protein